jgi:hypothetical protein
VGLVSIFCWEYDGGMATQTPSFHIVYYRT